MDILSYGLTEDSRVAASPYRTSATPIVDRHDQADAYEQLLRTRLVRSRRIAAVAVIAVSALSTLALLERRPTPDVHLDGTSALVVTANAIVADTRTQAELEQARFKEEVSAAMARDLLLPRTSGTFESCPQLSGRLPILVVKPGDDDLPSPSIGAILQDLGHAETQLGSDRWVEGIARANGLSASERLARLRYDVVVTASTWRRPIHTKEQAFEPGRIAGRAYLYDFSEHRVTCVGDVDASSSKYVEYSYSDQPNMPAALGPTQSLAANLDADLERQLMRSITAGLTRYN